MVLFLQFTWIILYGRKISIAQDSLAYWWAHIQLILIQGSTRLPSCYQDPHCSIINLLGYVKIGYVEVDVIWQVYVSASCRNYGSCM